jgi:hypothetical protein
MFWRRRRKKEEPAQHTVFLSCSSLLPIEEPFAPLRWSSEVIALHFHKIAGPQINLIHSYTFLSPEYQPSSKQAAWTFNSSNNGI